MVTQTLTFCASLNSIDCELSGTEPIQADPRDYGFDYDEQELAKELFASLPADLSIRPLTKVAADEFEQTFHSFHW